MTREDIIRMAKEADLWITSDERLAAVVRFANLVAAAELRRLYQVNLDLLSELYVLRASKHLKDVTAAYKKMAEGK